MVMLKGKYEFPQYTFEVKHNSPQKSFNVSGEFFEFIVYTMPDTYSSGSYSVSALIEPQYVPTAFEPEFPPDTNVTFPDEMIPENNTETVIPEQPAVVVPPAIANKTSEIVVPEQPTP